MPTIGTQTRTKPRLRIRKGHSPVQPDNLVESYPGKAAEVIKSGMLVCLDDDGLLVKATAALLDEGRTPFVAYADQSEFSAASAGLIPVIVCDGNYEIESAYMDAVAFNSGDLITGSATPGNFGKHARAADTTTIVGIAKGIRSYKHALPNRDFNNEADSATFDGDVVSFYTKHLPKVVV